MNLRFEDWLLILIVLVAIFMLLTCDDRIESQSHPLIETLDPPIPTATTPSDEAWKNLASVYNGGNLTATLMTASDTLTANNAKVTNNLDVTGTTTSKTANITNLNVTGTTATQSAKMTDLNVTGTTTVNRLYATGGMNGPGPDGAKYQTHFPWLNPSGQIDKNYIRGDTNIDGNVNMNGKTKFRVHNARVCEGPNALTDNSKTSMDACMEYCGENEIPCAQFAPGTPAGQCVCKKTLGFVSGSSWNGWQAGIVL